MWPFKKKAAPPVKSRKRAYSAATYNRLVSDWIAMTTSADAEIRGSLQKLRDRSRELERNNDLVRGFLRAVEVNVIGQGIPFQSQVLMQRGGKLDEKTNDLIEEKWNRWTRKQSCHTGGTLCFQDIERLAIRSTARDGDFFVRMVRQSFGGSRIPFALELIEADRIDTNFNGTADNGNDVRMGVELDQWSRPTAYYVLTTHPGDANLSAGNANRYAKTRVPASEIIPLGLIERAGQTRSVPWIVSAIMTMHHMDGYTQAEIVAARGAAALMGFIESPEGEVRGDEVTEDGEVLTEFEPGVFKYLGPGEKVSVPNIQRPGTQYSPFIKALTQRASSGWGISYESLSKDYAGATYSSARQALLEDRDNWRILQKWMIRNFHQLVFENWLDMAVLSGEISLPGYESMPEKYQGVKWMPRGWSWIDPAKEVEAWKSAIKGGLATITDVVAEEGDDFVELMLRRKREVDTIKSHGLMFDTDHAMTPQIIQTQAIAGKQSQGDTDNT